MCTHSQPHRQQQERNHPQLAHAEACLDPCRCRCPTLSRLCLFLRPCPSPPPPADVDCAPFTALGIPTEPRSSSPAFKSLPLSAEPFRNLGKVPRPPPLPAALSPTSHSATAAPPPAPLRRSEADIVTADARTCGRSSRFADSGRTGDTGRLTLVAGPTCASPRSTVPIRTSSKFCDAWSL